jgi:hypothetical protein
MDAKLGDTVAHRLNVAEKTSLKPLDPRNHNASNRGVCQMVEPRGELWECFDAEPGGNVVDRLHIVKLPCERSVLTTWRGFKAPGAPKPQPERLLRAAAVAPNASSANASVWGSGTAAATSPGQRLMLTQARCTAGDVAGRRAVEK